MDDYINREAVIKRKAFATLDCLGMEPTILASDVVSALQSLPAAGVRPVARVRWHSRFYYREGTGAYDCEMHVCSECGSEWSYDAETGVSDFNFCPNCGADMRET